MRTKEEIFQGEDETYFLLKCSMDPVFWCERVIGLDMQSYHSEWVHASMKHRFVNIQAHRGSGKTHIMGFALSTWFMWFGTPENPGKPVKILITSLALDQSKRLMEDISENLKNNELLQELIPTNRDQTWNKTELTTTKGDKVYCKAYNQGIKGYHVDVVLCDEAGTYSDHSIFHFTISPTVNHKKGRIITIGTPENVVDLLQELRANKQYWSGRYPALIKVDGEDVPLWPGKFSLEELKEIRERDGESSFQKEYLLNPKAEAENALYPPNMIHDCFDFDETFKHSLPSRQSIDEKGNMVEVVPELRNVFIGCDFAIASGPRADFDAYTVIEKFGDRVQILYGERHKGLHITGKVQRLKDLQARYNAKKIMCDSSNIGQAVIEQLRMALLPVEGVDFAPVNRNALLVALRQILEQQRLVIPRNADEPQGMAYVGVLVSEMVGFSETRTRSGLITYQSKGVHDDTVMSLCLALKGANAQKDFMDMLAI